jgi:hypothetical protein
MFTLVPMLTCGAMMATQAEDLMSSQEKSLKQLIQQQEILQVMSQYSHRWDSKDADGYSQLFTEDAVWEIWGLGAKKATLANTDS